MRTTTAQQMMPTKIEFDKMQKVCQLAYWIAAEIGNNEAYVCEKK
jgi:hypothetical protein